MIPRIQIKPREIPIRLRGWWLTRGRWKMMFIAAVFAWASFDYRHPILATILGLMLLDYAIHHRGNWLLRVLIGWLLTNVVYFALTGAL